MFTFIKTKLKNFLVNLLADELCKQDVLLFAPVKPQPDPIEDDIKKITTYWRVTGTAEVTSEIFQTPHKGQRAKSFLEVRTISPALKIFDVMLGLPVAVPSTTCRVTSADRAEMSVT